MAIDIAPGTERPDSSLAISVVELFTIGIGPSSSHTVGPMRAARDFADRVCAGRAVNHVLCELYGSLALTGIGHSTDVAVLLGLSGASPETIDPDTIAATIATIRDNRRLMLGGVKPIAFVEETDLLFRRGEFLPGHANAMRFTARFENGMTDQTVYYSIGGGAILREGEPAPRANFTLPHPFSSAAELLAEGEATGLSLGRIVEANELAWRPAAETNAFLDSVREAMLACITRGCKTDGILPGGLNVPRRARDLHATLVDRGPRSDPSAVFEWVSLWALAVNEENAAGGRVVTAPTNGAAGVLPAVLKYYEVFTAAPSRAGNRRHRHTDGPTRRASSPEE